MAASHCGTDDDDNLMKFAICTEVYGVREADAPFRAKDYEYNEKRYGSFNGKLIAKCKTKGYLDFKQVLDGKELTDR